MNPMRVLGDANDFGAVVAFLCSQQARFVTGRERAGRRRSLRRSGLGEGETSSDLRPSRRGQAAGRRPLGSAGIALRRGLRPQHPHGRRARGLGPHPRSRPRGAGPPRRARCRLRHRLSQLRAGGPGPSRHRRGLRARDGRRGAAQGGGARRADPARGGRRRAAPVCARQLRPRHQPPRALDAPAPGGGDRRVDPGPPAGRAPGHRRRAVRRRRPGGVRRWCPGEQRVRGDRRPAPIPRRPAAGGDRSSAEGPWPRGREQRPAARSRGGPGAADGRGRAGTPHARRYVAWGDVRRP